MPSRSAGSPGPPCYLLFALLLALVGNTAPARIQGSIVSGRGGALEFFFMGAYLRVGLAMLSPTVDELMRPGAAPVDELSTSRLAERPPRPG